MDTRDRGAKCASALLSDIQAIRQRARADLENGVAERIAIESYREMIAYLGDADPTTRSMLEAILASEEEHADDLGSLLYTEAMPGPGKGHGPSAGRVLSR